MAAVLRAQGVEPGDRVILLTASKVSHLTAYFATMALGAIPTHLHTVRPREFVEFAVENVGAKLIVTERCAESWEGMPVPVLAMPDLAAAREEAWSDERHEIAYMMYTSGTTGRPKAVMTTQANTLFTARTIIDFAELGPSERELVCMPLAFTFGLGHVHAQLLLGGSVHLLDGLTDVPRVLDVLAHDGITGFLGSPGMMRTLAVEHAEAFAESARGLGHIVINCTPMPVALTRTLLAMLPSTRIYMYYGLTEASRSAFNRYDARPEKIACTGRATNGVALRIDQPNEAGQGEICIKGPNVFPGYWGDAHPTGIDAEGWFHSGDLGTLDADGYITVTGRVNDQISVDGMKCQPLEVETVLAKHPSVRDVAVTALDDARTYQTVGAMVVANHRDSDRDALIAELETHCRRHLEAFKVPKRMLFVDQIPRTELGKIRRTDVRRMLTEAR